MHPLRLLFVGIAFLLLGGCHREPQPEKPSSTHATSRTAKLPVAYDTLPRLFELHHTIGESTYCLLAIPLPKSERFVECDALDSILVFVAAPGDSLYRLTHVLTEANGLCPSTGDPDQPAVRIESIDHGRRHVLILFTWGGGNSAASLGALVWLFPECQLLLEAEGGPKVFRLTADSILALAEYDALLPPPDLEGDIPQVSLAYPVTSLYILESGLSPEQIQRVWHEFLDVARQRALQIFEEHPEYTWAAIDYLVYSRLLGRTDDVHAFLRRVTREYRRQDMNAELAYVRFAVQRPFTPAVVPLDVILQAPHRLP